MTELVEGSHGRQLKRAAIVFLHHLILDNAKLLSYWAGSFVRSYSGGYRGGGRGPCPHPPRSPRPNFADAKVCRIQRWAGSFLRQSFHLVVNGQSVSLDNLLDRPRPTLENDASTSQASKSNFGVVSRDL